MIRLLRGDRFEVRINDDDDFIEKYGPEDEGSEWRKPRRSYEGLKRQRKSVEHYVPDDQPRLAAERGSLSGMSSQVGPFRHSEGRHERLSRRHDRRGFGHVGSRGGEGSDRESSTLSSEGRARRALTLRRAASRDLRLGEVGRVARRGWACGSARLAYGGGPSSQGV